MLSQGLMIGYCFVPMESWLIVGEDVTPWAVSEFNVLRVGFLATLSGKIQRGRNLSVTQHVINMEEKGIVTFSRKVINNK